MVEIPVVSPIEIALVSLELCMSTMLSPTIIVFWGLVFIIFRASSYCSVLGLTYLTLSREITALKYLLILNR